MARKYTINYYLEFLRKQNTQSLRNKLKKFNAQVISKIQERYKKLKKGYYLDYVARYEDFYMITTYEIDDDMTPVAIDIIRENKHQQYYCAMYSFGEFVGWQRYKMNYFNKRYCYTENLKDLFKDTEYKYSMVWELGNNIDIKIRNFLAYCNEKHIREIERLTKLKCYKLARDVMDGHAHFIDNNSNIIKALGLRTWQEMQKVIEMDMSADDVIAYINFNVNKLDFKYFKNFKSYFKYWSTIPNFQGFSTNTFVDYYLLQKKNKTFKGSFYNFVKDYGDYVGFGKKLKYDFQDTKYIKPINFQVAHDQAYLKIESEKNKKLDSAVNKILKQYQCLFFEKDDYAVVVPKTADEIRLEGKNMCNCVAGYVGRVKDKSSIICFVRHSAEKDKSFYTLELNPKDLKIVQCRGYYNGTTSEEQQVQKFVNFWRKNVVLKKLKVC